MLRKGEREVLKDEQGMTTRETIERYFDRLQQKSGWDASLSEDMVFTTFASPARQVTGRANYIESTKRFFSMISTLEVRDLLIDGDKACAVTRYHLQPPGGPAFVSDVAEVFRVRDGMIMSLDIYFDSSPFPKPPEP